MLLTNKDKRSKKYDSKRDPVEPAETHGRNPKRYNQNVCPVCGKAIERTASAGRRKHSCKHCGACLNRDFICASCGTSRVWQGKRGIACRGCGAAYRRAAKYLPKNAIALHSHRIG